MGKKPEHTHTIGHAYKDNTFLRKMSAIIERVRRGPGVEGASVDPDHDGTLFAR
jgi:hypothetical protein